MYKEFTKAREYQEQNRESLRVVQKVTDELAEARSELGKLRSKHAELLRQSAIADVDNDAELTEIERQIEYQQLIIKRKEQTQEALREKVPDVGKITPADVLTEWNSKYIPAYRKAVHDPILAEMLAAKRAYLLAVEKYHRSVRFIDDTISETDSLLGGGYLYKLAGVKFNYQEDKDRYLVNDQFVQAVNANVNYSAIQTIKEGK